MRTHTLDIYGAKLYLATSKAEWKQLKADLDFLGKRPTGRGEVNFSGGHVVIWIGSHDSLGALVDTCSHEATHAAQEILEWADIYYIGEPFAYLAGWIARWAFEGVYTTEEVQK